ASATSSSDTTAVVQPGETAKKATPTSRPKSFYGAVEINPSTAKMRLVQVADEIISVLASDPNASLQITVEIHADVRNGASDQIKRAVSENATSLGFKAKGWE